ncbi:hypothetical protein NDU88_001998 [Pleurodeles waltl]|uniref:Uncharacterized protein n=1 Tax=Pleurodeles waltl TaxID=8319 RepID=A0AAV7MLX5_PLEWA|nr:hypothetical protein NDU88_001998 [Pleurodeles waltl]
MNLSRIGGHVEVVGRRDDIARDTRGHADLNTEREVDANMEEGEQDGEEQAGEEIPGRDGRELKTTPGKERYPETKGRAEERQADAEKSGRRRGTPRVPGGTWLTPVCDRRRGHLGSVLTRVGKKGEMKGQNTGLGLRCKPNQ